MENFDEIKKLWSENSLTVNQVDVDQLISNRIKKVKNNFREYFWASFFYQNLVYGCLAFLIVRYFGRPDIMIPSVAGIVLYIPFTIMFMKKFKSAFQPKWPKWQDLAQNGVPAIAPTKEATVCVSAPHALRRTAWMRVINCVDFVALLL
jgi:hypothetical protein